MHRSIHPFLEGSIIGVYLVLMVVVGLVFKRFNRDTNDYFRGGCRATWWLVGVSAFMAGFSAWTFTGAAGAIYSHGWSILVIYLGNAAGFFLNFLFFAPWARQMRTVTSPEAIQLRFNETTRAFYALIVVIMSLLYAALQLYGLALFSSSVFGLPLGALIVALGGVVLVYSTLGGSWAVMATDFLQGIILIPVTVLLGVLCLQRFGGVGAFLEAIRTHGLQTEYSLIKDSAHAVAGSFTLGWASAMFVQAVLGLNSLGGATRYFAVKDGRAARKAALLGSVLFLFGSIFWFIPPMTSRLLFSEAIAQMPYGRPEETAYAVASFSILPSGLVGVMVVAIFAATMSAMGPGLNGNAGVVIYDLYPLLRRALGRPAPDVSRLLTASRITTVMLGSIVILIALYFSQSHGAGLFDAMLNIGAMLALPLAVPMVLCLFLQRSPAWAALFTAGGTFVVSALGYFSESLFGQAWNFQTKVFANVGTGTVLYFITLLFWSRTSQAYKTKAARFFETMHTPVDFETEVGAPNDGRQLRFIGVFGLTIGLLILALCGLPAPARDRIATAAVGLTILGIGGGMYLLGRRSAT